MEGQTWGASRETGGRRAEGGTLGPSRWIAGERAGLARLSDHTGGYRRLRSPLQVDRIAE
jgi:hypothetical protein